LTEHGVDRNGQVVDVWYIRSADGTSGADVGATDGTLVFSVGTLVGRVVGAGVM
jgi:hypothetical protein